MKIEDAITHLRELAKGETTSRFPLNDSEIADWLEELVRLREANQPSEEERTALEMVETIEQEFTDELSFVEEYSEEDLRNMNYDCDDSEGDKLYHRIGEVLFGEDRPSRVHNLMTDLNDYLRSNQIYLELFAEEGKTQDADEYIFHEYDRNHKDCELRWLAISPKMAIVREKVLEFGW